MLVRARQYGPRLGKPRTNETYFGSDSVTTGDYDVYVASTEGDNMGQRLLQGYINSDGNGHCDFKLNSDGTMADADSSGMPL